MQALLWLYGHQLLQDFSVVPNVASSAGRKVTVRGCLPSFLLHAAQPMDVPYVLTIRRNAELPGSS